MLEVQADPPAVLAAAVGEARLREALGALASLAHMWGTAVGPRAAEDRIPRPLHDPAARCERSVRLMAAELFHEDWRIRHRGAPLPPLPQSAA